MDNQIYKEQGNVQQQNIAINAPLQQQQQNMMANVPLQQIVQPMVNRQMPGQVHPGAAGVVMTQQQQNARNKKERQFRKKISKDKKKIEKIQKESLARWQETASQMRDELMQKDIQEGMDILNEMEMEKGTEFLEQEQEQYIREKIVEAERITIEHQVVRDATVEQVKKYGCASYKQIVTIEEAKKVVEESGGFLYYKEVQPGLAELRPTLPETIKLENVKKEIPLRRTYNILISKLAQSIVDEKGNLLQNAVENAEKLEEALKTIGKEDKQKRKDKIAVLKKAGIDNKTISYIELYAKQYTEDDSYTFIPREILEDFCNMVSNISCLGDMSEDGIRKKQEEFEQQFLKENNEEKLTEIQKSQLSAIPNMYEEAKVALQEMAKLRNLDPDTKDVALPNACSANAIFQERNRILVGKNQEKRIKYQTSSHFEKNLKIYAQFIEDNMGWLSKGRFTEKQKKLYLASVREAKKIIEEIEKGEVITQEKEEQLQKAKERMQMILEGENSPIKYDYHQLGVVGTISNEIGSITYTIETFAAEIKQYVVSPFTQKVAIGRYKGKPDEGNFPTRTHKGVDAYYNCDNPLANGEERILAEMKKKIRKNNNPE